MAEWSSNEQQIVNPGETVIFTENPVPCDRGFIRHRDETGNFLLKGWTPCCCKKSANYLVDFGANIAIPTGGTVEPISLAIAIDGEVDPSSTMIFTPAAVEEFGNVSANVVVSVPWICRCASVSIRNISTQDIQVQNANIVFDYLGIRR